MIPALTVHRPWAALILLAGKDVENRSWHTNYRGPLLIHAGKTWDDDALPFASEIRSADGMRAAGWVSVRPDDHETGILGVVDLVDVVRDHTSPWAVRGQWHWLRARPRMFPEAIPCAGRQGLWAYPKSSHVAELVAAALDAVVPAADETCVVCGKPSKDAECGECFVREDAAAVRRADRC